ncbi:MAG: YtxH domain-containing protein [Cyclobacteriaceae bacterium]|nr:YtxH domain-containing protein [Cyclobacteriaceae bacterium]
MKGDSFKILTGFFIGAMGGLLAGLLIAPESGSDTRKKISKTASQFKDDLQELAEETIESAKKSLSESVDELLKTQKDKVKLKS